MIFLAWMPFVAITIVLVVILFAFGRHGGQSKEKSIPGPSHIINESEVLSKASGGLAKFVMHLHEKYGPIVSFTLGSLKLVSIGSPDLFKQHQHVFDRPVELFTNQLGIIGKGSIQIANGDRGKSLHKSLSRPFSFPECKQYYSALRKIGEKYIQRLESSPRESHIPIQESMLILTVKEVALLSFGYEFDDDDIARKQIQSYKDAFGDVFYGDEEPIRAQEKVMQQGIANYRQFLKDALEARLMTRHLDSSTYFVDVLLDLGLEKDEELDNAVTFFTGAFHTTANLMTWLLYYVGKYPNVQDKLRKELDDVLKGGDVSNDNVQQLKYLHQVIDETLRHSCLAPFAARCSPEDVQLGGYTIPAKTPVIHCLGHSLVDPQYWSTEGTLPPTEFDPERFSEVNSRSRPNLSFAPFGFAGKRICPGYRFAYVVVAVLVSLILRRFRVRLVEGQDIQRVIGFVSKPNTEIWMTVEDL